MTKHDSSQGGTNRRAFLTAAGSALAAAPTLTPTLSALARRKSFGPSSSASPYGPLFPTKDKETGLELLKLPRGFSYRSVGWTGDVMHDGTLTPDRHDGMAVVSNGDMAGDEIVLIRNHERGASDPTNPLPVVGGGQAPIYDNFAIPGVLSGLGGGTTTLRFRNGKLVDSRGSLAGTLTNCAGGKTPWGSWLTCEEVTIRGGLIGAQDHGYVFEVPGNGVASARPIREMGFMDHEAVAVDPRDSRVYLTEDNGPNSGFYRFTPNDTSGQVGSLENGGTLEMMKIRGQNNFDLRAVQQDQKFDVEWVLVANPDADPERFVSPDPGFPPIEGAGKSGPFLQGEAQGAAFMARGEGCWYDRGIIYVIDTSGGAAGKGIVFAYEPGAERLKALFVSPDEITADNPDNITVSPTGAVVVCEDGGGLRDGQGVLTTGARMLGINNDGSSYVFAENNMLITGPIPNRPFIEPNDYRGSEWAGATFDPSGRTLFVNIQTPGVTYLISGPWARGPL